MNYSEQVLSHAGSTEGEKESSVLGWLNRNLDRYSSELDAFAAIAVVAAIVGGIALS